MKIVQNHKDAPWYGYKIEYGFDPKEKRSWVGVVLVVIVLFAVVLAYIF